MLTNSQTTILHRAIPYLPDGWRHIMQRSGQAAVWIEGPEMRAFRVGITGSRIDVMGERFHVWCSGLGDEPNGSTPLPPEITVRIDATPKHLADEISRRFLPQYEAFYQASIQAMEGQRKRNVKKQTLGSDAVTINLLVDQIRQLVMVAQALLDIVKATHKHIPELPLGDAVDDAEMAISEAQDWIGDKPPDLCTSGICTFDPNE